METLLSVAAGVALLTILVVDIFLTVFHAQGRAGPLTRWQSRAIWTLFRHAPASAQSFAAPLMIVQTLLLWALMFVVGYAFIYYPFITGFLVSPGPLRARISESLYFSGIAGATLGTGDLVPNRDALRLLSVVQAFSGFALISVSISYLLATHRELIGMRALAHDIAGWFRVNDPDTSIHYPEAVARWCEQVDLRLLHVLHAHFQYPILQYFHPSNTDWALAVQLQHLLELRNATSQGSHPLHRHPSCNALFSTVDDYVGEVVRNFVPGSSREGTAEGLRRLRAWTRFSESGS